MDAPPARAALPPVGPCGVVRRLHRLRERVQEKWLRKILKRAQKEAENHLEARAMDVPGPVHQTTAVKEATGKRARADAQGPKAPKRKKQAGSDEAHEAGPDKAVPCDAVTPLQRQQPPGAVAPASPTRPVTPAAAAPAAAVAPAAVAPAALAAVAPATPAAATPNRPVAVAAARLASVAPAAHIPTPQSTPAAPRAIPVPAPAPTPTVAAQPSAELDAAALLEACRGGSTKRQRWSHSDTEYLVKEIKRAAISGQKLDYNGICSSLQMPKDRVASKARKMVAQLLPTVEPAVGAALATAVTTAKSGPRASLPVLPALAFNQAYGMAASPSPAPGLAPIVAPLAQLAQRTTAAALNGTTPGKDGGKKRRSSGGQVVRRRRAKQGLSASQLGPVPRVVTASSGVATGTPVTQQQQHSSLWEGHQRSPSYPGARRFSGGRWPGLG